MSVELPFNEELRLADLESYDIMDTPPEEDFNELVELAAQMCKAPISYISLIDKNRQWFKAKKGIECIAASKEIAFCTHAILQDEMMEVPDTKKDDRFNNNPIVTEHNIRFYAGAPIISPAGHRLGTICVMDTQPRKLLPEEQRALIILSKQVTKLLEFRKKNLLIRQRAEELIAIKNKVIDNVIRQKEDDRKQIANKLHEDLAQSLASGIMYLSMVKGKTIDESPFIDIAKKQFSEVLTGICDLSYNIIPVSVPWVPAEELIKEFIEKIAPAFSFNLGFIPNEKKGSCCGNKAFTAIRIIEQWLKILSKKDGISRVNISAQTIKDFEIVIEDDGPPINLNTMRREVLESVAYEIAHTANGKISLSVSPQSKNLFKIKLPASPVQDEKIN